MNQFLIMLLLPLLTACYHLPSLQEVRLQHPSSFKEILDTKGELLHESRVNFQVNRRAWLSLDEVPEALTRELVQLEDQRFFRHPGVDVLALFNALKNFPHRGSSTITMQVVSLLRQQRGRKDLIGKMAQIKAAFLMEWSWKKRDILEAYLNLLPFKGELQGLTAASFSIFGKYPNALNREERALLYAMIPGPNRPREEILRRACRYFEKLHNESNCSVVTSTLDHSFFRAPRTELLASFVPHVAEKIKQLEGDMIRTTLRKDIQLEALRALQTQVRHLNHRNVTDGAVLVIKRDTAEVVAYVGSSGHFSRAPKVDHVQALRQAGSTLKPFLFATALKKKLITMSSPFKDEPFSVSVDGMTYRPENYQQSFSFQDVPAKIALGSSLNIPAVKIIDLVGPERFYQLLQELAFRQLAPPENYGHSMALGAVDITLWDLVRAYRALAEGDLKEPYFTGLGTVGKKIADLSPDVSFLVGHMLSEKENRALTFGLQSVLATESWSAVKTGTSKDMRDNWCVGYSDSYVIGVWIGNSSGEPMWNVTGVSGAGPIFARMFAKLHKKASYPPITPAGIIKQGQDFYLAGTEPKGKGPRLLEQSHLSKIIYPQHGTQFAYDPEIPEVRQRIHFRQSSPRGRLKLNGRSMSEAELKDGFLPVKKGKYQVELWEEDDLKDSVTFTIKAGK
jgi:penicillin-binding protein 1C